MAVATITNEKLRKKNTTLLKLSFAMIMILLGLRDEVGGDWISYLLIHDSISELSLAEAINYTDPAYALVSWLANYASLEIYAVNFICATIFTYGLFQLCAAQVKPWLALCIAIPYIITAVAMGYTRQSVALGFAFLAILAIQDHKSLKFILLIAVATLFHKSAIFCLLFGFKQFNLREFLKKFALPIIISFVFLSFHAEHISQIYLSGEVESDGGIFRLLINFIAAFLFFVFGRKWRFNWPKTYYVTRNLAIFSIIMLPFGLFFSTLTDRLALYLTPIQIIVYSRFPLLLPPSFRGGMMMAIILMYLTIYTAWLTWSPWAQCCWIPYRIYLPS